MREGLIRAGLYRLNGMGDPAGAIPQASRQWRIATTPFYISPSELSFFEELGRKLFAFYQAVNQLYFDSVQGREPSWVAALLDQGKPLSLVEYGRMNRFKSLLPTVIRPDLIPTDEGIIATELDSVPGGIGLTAALLYAYIQEGAEVLSGDRMVNQVAKMFRHLSPKSHPVCAIVVSEESKDYRPEMEWLAVHLNKQGLSTFVPKPSEIQFDSREGLYVDSGGAKVPLDIVYRFFELFDLQNVPKSELILYAAKKKGIFLTPPFKPPLEEKSVYALFHHPVLKKFWLRHLGEKTFLTLRQLFPHTWMMDAQSVPPHAVIPDLLLDGEPVTDFRQLGRATQKGRQYVIKPSGFSEMAWGSRGVKVGHDLSATEWQTALEQALHSPTPHILQKFHQGKKVSIDYYDFERGCPVTMEGRVRLSPYYFVAGKEVGLGGVLATVCSLEKKLIHGMADAVMAPVAVSEKSACSLKCLSLN